jgi:DNA-binding transcriptional regulator YdaS (Cro superfamily)
MSKLTSPEKVALRRAADILGGQAALASVLGYPDRRNVWPWFNTDRPLPAEHCPAIERATGGAVRCEELRPDVAWDVLREQAATQP